MRVAVAPDKFKGSLTAVEAAEAIGEGLRHGRPGVDLERCQRDASTLLVSLARSSPKPRRRSAPPLRRKGPMTNRRRRRIQPSPVDEID